VTTRAHHFDHTDAMHSIQQVQSLPALQASIRFIPNILIGIISIPLLSMILHKVSAYWLVLVPSVICVVAPILMAVTNPTWPYWYGSFWAILLSPLGADGMLSIQFCTRAVRCVANTIYSSLVSSDSSHNIAVPIAHAIRGWRCVQHDSSVWTGCRIGCHGSNCSECH